MKKIIRLYTLLVVSCLLLAGCNSDEDVGGLGDPVAVQFGMGNISRLKTTYGGDQWSLNDPVGIFMLKSGQALSSANIAEGADNIEYKALTGGSAISPFTPASGNPVFYPHNGDVDFIAYYPYKSPVTNYTLPIDVSDQSDASKIDVLYSRNATGYSKHSGVVDLQFSHALSKLSFTLTPGTGAPALAGAKIEITNLATTADMNLADGMVTPTNSGQTITANTAATGLSSSAIVIPQTLSGTKLIVTLADNVSVFEWDFPVNTEFLSGKNHQYTITVSKTGIKVSSSGITIWTGTGDPATPGTAETLTQYKVGDYYPDPTNSGTAIGVVFWLDPAAWGYDSSGTPTGYFGKIVSLDQKNDVRWGNKNIDEQAVGVEGIRDTSDGYQGTFNLISKRKDKANFSTTYEAFYWIYQKNGNSVNGMWYLPAQNELKSLYDVLSSVNPVLQNAGGTLLKQEWYWSSTESNYHSGYMFGMHNGYSNTTTIKEQQCYVRAILAF